MLFLIYLLESFSSLLCLIFPPLCISFVLVADLLSLSFQVLLKFLLFLLPLSLNFQYKFISLLCSWVFHAVVVALFDVIMIGQYILRFFLEVFILEFVPKITYFILDLAILDLKESVLVHFLQFFDIVLGFRDLNYHNNTMRCGAILWLMFAATFDPT